MKKKVYQNIVVMHVREHSSIYLFVIVLFLMGVIFGAVVVNSMSFIQKQDLLFYLQQFFGHVQEGTLIRGFDLFQSSLFYHIKYISFIFILGLSIIGIPIIWIFIFMKGVVGSNTIEANARMCMTSAVTGYFKTFTA